MDDSMDVRFVSFGGAGCHILIGQEDEHHGLALCGEQHVWLDDPYFSDTWQTLPDSLYLTLGDLCADCFAAVGRFIPVGR